MFKIAIFGVDELFSHFCKGAVVNWSIGHEWRRFLCVGSTASLVMLSAVTAFNEGQSDPNSVVSNCSIAAPTSISSEELELACGSAPSIPRWVMSGSKVDLHLFTNARGGYTGVRTAKKGGTVVTLDPDRAGHGGSAYKLKWAKSGGYYSISANGSILRWKKVASMAAGNGFCLEFHCVNSKAA